MKCVNFLYFRHEFPVPQNEFPVFLPFIFQNYVYFFCLVYPRHPPVGPRPGQPRLFATLTRNPERVLRPLALECNRAPIAVLPASEGLHFRAAHLWIAPLCPLVASGGIEPVPVRSGFEAAPDQPASLSVRPHTHLLVHPDDVVVH